MGRSVVAWRAAEEELPTLDCVIGQRVPAGGAALSAYLIIGLERGSAMQAEVVSKSGRAPRCPGIERCNTYWHRCFPRTPCDPRDRNHPGCPRRLPNRLLLASRGTFG
ncbi:hypothetical protein GCM10027456_24980 [Kineosporia babensis]